MPQLLSLFVLTSLLLQRYYSFEVCRKTLKHVFLRTDTITVAQCESNNENSIAPTTENLLASFFIDPTTAEQCEAVPFVPVLQRQYTVANFPKYEKRNTQALYDRYSSVSYINCKQNE